MNGASNGLEHATSVAAAIAREHGIVVDETRVLSNGANVIAWLHPAPVVARVAAVTAFVRARPEACLERDVDIAAFCASRGAAVVAPSSELPLGPHHRDGRVVTFWEHVDHDNETELDGAAFGRALAELHAVLRDYTAPLPYLSPALDDALEVLERIEQRELASRDEIATRRDAVEACRDAIERTTMPVQALHGDAHPRNALRTPAGLLWTDFEDTCRGPIAWDLATLGRRSGPPALTAYGELAERPTDAELAPFIAARVAQGAVWNLVWQLRDAGAFDRIPDR